MGLSFSCIDLARIFPYLHLVVSALRVNNITYTKDNLILKESNMAADHANHNTAAIAGPYPTCMESVNRFSKLPVVESTIQTATSIYEKVKDYNSVTNWTLSTAENMGTIVVEVSKPITTPVIRNLEGPIKKVDGVLCTGLDYVENKVPAVKLPPGELIMQIYTSTKDYVNNTVYPAVECARAYAEPAVKTAKDFVEPAVEKARTAVEPAVDMAKQYVEPYVQPALNTVNAVKENVLHKVDEYLHRSHNHEGDFKECEQCLKVKEELEKQHAEQQKNQ